MTDPPAPGDCPAVAAPAPPAHKAQHAAGAQRHSLHDSVSSQTIKPGHAAAIHSPLLGYLHSPPSSGYTLQSMTTGSSTLTPTMFSSQSFGMLPITGAPADRERFAQRALGHVFAPARPTAPAAAPSTSARATHPAAGASGKQRAGGEGTGPQDSKLPAAPAGAAPPGTTRGASADAKSLRGTQAFELDTMRYAVASQASTFTQAARTFLQAQPDYRSPPSVRKARQPGVATPAQSECGSPRSAAPSCEGRRTSRSHRPRRHRTALQGSSVDLDATYYNAPPSSRRSASHRGAAPSLASRCSTVHDDVSLKQYISAAQKPAPTASRSAHRRDRTEPERDAELRARGPDSQHGPERSSGSARCTQLDSLRSDRSVQQLLRRSLTPQQRRRQAQSAAPMSRAGSAAALHARDAAAGGDKAPALPYDSICDVDRVCLALEALGEGDSSMLVIGSPREGTALHRTVDSRRGASASLAPSDRAMHSSSADAAAAAHRASMTHTTSFTRGQMWGICEDASDGECGGNPRAYLRAPSHLDSYAAAQLGTQHADLSELTEHVALNTLQSAHAASVPFSTHTSMSVRAIVDASASGPGLAAQHGGVSSRESSAEILPSRHASSGARAALSLAPSDTSESLDFNSPRSDASASGSGFGKQPGCKAPSRSSPHRRDASQAAPATLRTLPPCDGPGSHSAQYASPALGVPPCSDLPAPGGGPAAGHGEAGSPERAFFSPDSAAGGASPPLQSLRERYSGGTPASTFGRHDSWPRGASPNPAESPPRSARMSGAAPRHEQRRASGGASPSCAAQAVAAITSQWQRRCSESEYTAASVRVSLDAAGSHECPAGARPRVRRALARPSHLHQELSQAVQELEGGNPVACPPSAPTQCHARGTHEAAQRHVSSTRHSTSDAPCVHAYTQHSEAASTARRLALQPRKTLPATPDTPPAHPSSPVGACRTPRRPAPSEAAPSTTAQAYSRTRQPGSAASERSVQAQGQPPGQPASHDSAGAHSTLSVRRPAPLDPTLMLSSMSDHSSGLLGVEHLVLPQEQGSGEADSSQQHAKPAPAAQGVPKLHLQQLRPLKPSAATPPPAAAHEAAASSCQGPTRPAQCSTRSAASPLAATGDWRPRAQSPGHRESAQGAAPCDWPGVSSSTTVYPSYPASAQVTSASTGFPRSVSFGHEGPADAAAAAAHARKRLSGKVGPAPPRSYEREAEAEASPAGAAHLAAHHAGAGGASPCVDALPAAATHPALTLHPHALGGEASGTARDVLFRSAAARWRGTQRGGSPRLAGPRSHPKAGLQATRSWPGVASRGAVRVSAVQSPPPLDAAHSLHSPAHTVLSALSAGDVTSRSSSPISDARKSQLAAASGPAQAAREPLQRTTSPATARHHAHAAPQPTGMTSAYAVPPPGACVTPRSMSARQAGTHSQWGHAMLRAHSGNPPLLQRLASPRQRMAAQHSSDAPAHGSAPMPSGTRTAYAQAAPPPIRRSPAPPPHKPTGHVLNRVRDGHGSPLPRPASASRLLHSPRVSGSPWNSPSPGPYALRPSFSPQYGVVRSTDHTSAFLSPRLQRPGDHPPSTSNSLHDASHLTETPRGTRKLSSMSGVSGSLAHTWGLRGTLPRSNSMRSMISSAGWSARGVTMRPDHPPPRWAAAPSEAGFTPQLSFDGAAATSHDGSWFDVLLGPGALRATMLMACPDDQVRALQQSYLYKVGRLFGAMHRRWYVLKGNVLHTSHSPYSGPSTPVGTVTAVEVVAPSRAERPPLSGASVPPAGTLTARRAHELRFLFTDGSSKSLYASEGVCRQWESAVRVNTQLTTPLLKSLFEVRLDEIIAEGGCSIALRSRRVTSSPADDELPLCLKLCWDPLTTGSSLGSPASCTCSMELATMAALDEHQHIMPVHAVLHSLNRTYIVTDFYKGGNLIEHIAQLERYTERKAAEIAAQLADALQAIHKKGVAHLDIKPENVVFDASGCLKVIDFGIAAFMGQPCPIGGTAEFMPPELIDRGTLEEGPGWEQDVWSFGVLVYFMLSGVTPFFAGSMEAILENVRIGAFEWHGKQWDSVSFEAKELITNCLQRDPALRWKPGQILQCPWIRGDGGDAARSAQPAARCDHKRDARALSDAHDGMRRLHTALEDQRQHVVSAVLNVQAAATLYRAHSEAGSTHDSFGLGPHSVHNSVVDLAIAAAAAGSRDGSAHPGSAASAAQQQVGLSHRDIYRDLLSDTMVTGDSVATPASVCGGASSAAAAPSAASERSCPTQFRNFRLDAAALLDPGPLGAPHGGSARDRSAPASPCAAAAAAQDEVRALRSAGGAREGAAGAAVGLLRPRSGGLHLLEDLPIALEPTSLSSADEGYADLVCGARVRAPHSHTQRKPAALGLSTILSESCSQWSTGDHDSRRGLQTGNPRAPRSAGQQARRLQPQPRP